MPVVGPPADATQLLGPDALTVFSFSESSSTCLVPLRIRGIERVG